MDLIGWRQHQLQRSGAYRPDFLNAMIPAQGSAV